MSEPLSPFYLNIFRTLRNFKMYGKKSCKYAKGAKLLVLQLLLFLQRICLAQIVVSVVAARVGSDRAINCRLIKFA